MLEVARKVRHMRAIMLVEGIVAGVSFSVKWSRDWRDMMDGGHWADK